MSRKKKWLLGIGLSLVLGVVALFVAAAVLARRFEPYIREQAILYLSTRFDSEVEIAALRVRMPKTSPFRLRVDARTWRLSSRRGRGDFTAPQGSS